MTLDETSSDNSGVISANNSETCNVALTRSIEPNTYNTLSLPFDVDNDVLKATFGDDVELAQLNGTHMDDGTLYFDFVPADAITAGVPYLIYVTADVQNPLSFDDVTLKEGTQPVVTSLASFIPVFDVTTLDNGNENILFLGANNTLFYPSVTSGDMKGFRAYFEVTGEAQGAKAMVMMDNSLTGVKTILNESLQNEQVYDLQGRMVTPLAKGFYILNGKKVSNHQVKYLQIMEKRKYVSPRTSRVNVMMDGNFLMASETPSTNYRSTGLGHGDGVSGNGDGGDAAGALSKVGFWEFN